MCTVRAFSKHGRFDFLADDQRLAVHFRGLLKAHHVEDRRRNIGEAALTQLGPLAETFLGLAGRFVDLPALSKQIGG